MSRVHWLLATGLLSAFLLIVAVVFLGQARHTKPRRRISLRSSSAEPVSSPRRTKKLRIAVGAIISPSRSLVFYDELFDYIGRKLDRDVEMLQRKTYAEVNFLIEQGRIDAAFVCSRPYVQGHRDFALELLCVPVCFGKTQYCSYIIVHKDSAVAGLEDLRGKLFAFSDPLSNSGMLIPLHALARMGETPESFFKGHVFTYSHDNSIRSVAEEFVDGAAVDSLIWEYLAAGKSQWAAQTKIVHRSEPCAIPPVVVSPNIDGELKEKLRSAFLDMHNDPQGRKILKKILVDRFATIDDSAYDSIRRMEAFVSDFRSQN